MVVFEVPDNNSGASTGLVFMRRLGEAIVEAFGLTIGAAGRLVWDSANVG